jgi:hypothetical protein
MRLQNLSTFELEEQQKGLNTHRPQKNAIQIFEFSFGSSTMEVSHLLIENLIYHIFVNEEEFIFFNNYWKLFRISISYPKEMLQL